MTKMPASKILVKFESETQEFKEKLSRDVKKGLDRDIASFANTRGGTIYVGINNNGEPVGYGGNLQKDSDSVTQLALKCRPPISPKISIQDHEGKRILVIEVDKSPILHCDNGGRFPHRINSITGNMDFSTLKKALEERSIISPTGDGGQTGIQPTFYGGSEKAPLSDQEIDLYKKNLEARNSWAIDRIGNDLYYHLKDDPSKFKDFIPLALELLSCGNSKNRMNGLRILGAFVTEDKIIMSEVVTEAFDKVMELAEKDEHSGVKRLAYTFLLDSCDGRIVDVMFRALTTLDEDTFKQLNMLDFFSWMRWENKKELKKKLRLLIIDKIDEAEYDDQIKNRMSNAHAQLGM